MVFFFRTMVSSNDIVASLKCELERCLVSNKQKRAEVTELKEEMRKVKKEMMDFRQRCEHAELLTQEQKVSQIYLFSGQLHFRRLYIGATATTPR